MRPFNLGICAGCVAMCLLAASVPGYGQFRGYDRDSDSRRGYSRDDSRSRDDSDSRDRGSDDRRDSGRDFWNRGDSGRDYSSRWGGYGSRGNDSDGRDGNSDSRRDFFSRGGFGGPPGGFGGSFGPPGGFGGGFGPPGGFGGGFGPPGGFGSRDRGSDDGSSRSAAFFDRLDRNGDGRLDGDEMSKVGPLQGFLERAGIREGASRDDFTRSMDRMREESRRDGDDRSRNSASSGYRPAPKVRVTKDLPSSFTDRDFDKDGQIGLYEWREWDRTRVDEFFFFDRNGDGFLTPKELASAEGNSGDDGGNDSGRRDRGDSSRDRRSESAPTQTSATAPASTSVAALDESDPNVSQGRKYFALLDGNKDGKASVDELAKLKKLRPLFESANIRLDQEMSADQFVANYVKASTN